MEVEKITNVKLTMVTANGKRFWSFIQDQNLFLKPNNKNLSMKTSRLWTIHLIWIFFFIGCSGKQNTSFEIIPTSSQNLIDTLHLETVLMDSIPSSYLGVFALKDKHLFFIDRLTGKLFKFSNEGKLERSLLGFGESPSEINTQYIDGAILSDQLNVFIGSNFDMHVFDSNWDRQKVGIIDWKWETSNINEVEVPNPDERALYTFDYENLKLVQKGDFIYAPIYSEHHNFNPFTTHRFYRESYILAEISLLTFEVTRLLGKRSEKYLDYRYLGHHAFFDFEPTEKGFYISHEIDSLIYFMDNGGDIRYAFGREGNQMDKTYKEVAISDLRNKEDVAKVREAFVSNRPSKGFYTSIWYCRDQELLFRTYARGGNSDSDGLQIYLKEQLVGDVSVPKGFHIIGRLDEEFVAIPARKENDMALSFFTFTIPESDSS